MYLCFISHVEGDTVTKVQIPAKAVATDGDDISTHTTSLLGDLNLLPNADDLKKAGDFGSVLGGPPQSVAVIEANATALSKWWAAGLGAAAAGAWTAVRVFWNANAETPGNQRMMLLGAAIVSAGIVLTIGYILGSDVRGRSAASVATIEARSSVARAMIDVSERQFRPEVSESSRLQLVALPAALPVRWTAKTGDDENGWRAIVLKIDGDDNEYMLVKGSSHAWAPAGQVIVQ